ncbi:phosphate:acyl-[acyl carrier protein] acyltransferase [Tissierella praeacuta DSM 18095]|uniref:Phosphate acyltransferase n=1 Tax=Tissierella praeacuta DSM 18095 TaxID=1123404 RepID=A0A1M4SP94_9FIRM|nr:phosphate acyltransferase PlsX [Tissierella praeacuta]SHE34021.1 phosphate:acyl-[acyl carrier protein] acyltransferase [Tissierella praeacuta DSM 18095]SUP01621.1 Phosphate acyltransferase [Tissierella praeacuta]
MKIIIDAMGGDKGPIEMVKGTIDAVNEYGVNVILVGKEDIIQNELKKYSYPKDKVEILVANDIITNEDDPAMAIRRKKDSSMVVGAKALSDGIGDGFISAGSTGALLASGIFIVKRIEGIDRAALTVIYPTIKGFSLLLDAGANVDCKPEYLYQFALMASVYMEKAMGVKSPTIGLINIGSEEGKGNLLSKETYEILKKSQLNFKGNIEARELPSGTVDIIVSDGFVGNVALKLTEGMAISIFSILKEEFIKNSRTKVGAALLKPELRNIKAMMDYREQGGAPLLGIRKPMVKAHGSSDAFAIKNAINQLIKFIEKDVIKIIEDNMHVLDNK